MEARTCHSASALGGPRARDPVNLNAFVNRLADAGRGVVAFASSQGSEVSLENPAWNTAPSRCAEGSARRGKADYRHTGEITLSFLDAYVADRVKELADRHQHPVMTQPKTDSDFPIGIARK